MWILSCLPIGFVHSFSLEYVLKETGDFPSDVVLTIKVIRNGMVTWKFHNQITFCPPNCQEC